LKRGSKQAATKGDAKVILNYQLFIINYQLK